MRRATTIPFPGSSVQVEVESGDAKRVRYPDGWRRGKPVEDPEKTKRWGFVTAKPSEYLVHVRHGKIRPKSSGQGASCFKLPWDSVAIIPTTINRLQFEADQVTREKVGVEVTGLAVYRITNPELTYKMLNFSYTERAQEKLDSILREMFMGSVRRIVANMEVEDVLTRRKEGLAEEILREIQPIVAGRGRDSDGTSRGWGVVIDTIEIQDVRVLSEKVFANMQATFRNALALRARTAELQAAKEIAENETRNAREIAEARISAEAGTRELKAVAESRAAEIELSEAVKRQTAQGAAAQAAKLATIERERQLKLAEEQKQRDARLAALAREQAEVEGARTVEETRHLAEREAAERRAELAQWEQQAQVERERTESDARIARERAETEARAAMRERQLAIEKLEGDTMNAIALGARQIENLITDEALRRDMVATLPSVAEAFGKSMGEMKFVQFGGDGAGNQADPLQFLVKAFAQVVEVAKSAKH